MTTTQVSRRALTLAALSLLVPSAVLASLATTPGTSEGPFYPPQRPRDDDWDLVRVEGAVREAGGEILQLKGRVLDRNGHAIAAARVEIWQCDVNGVYLHPGDRRISRRDKGFQGFGHAISDVDGRFAFRTIVPVPYTGRTPHIHIKVLHRGRELLTTQLYRAGFPQNDSDFLFRRLSRAAQNRVSMVLQPSKATSRTAYETEIDLVLGL